MSFYSLNKKNYFKIDSHRPSLSSIRNNSSSSSTHLFQILPEYTAYLNSDTDILDSSSSNHSPSAPYSPDRATVTPNNTSILQTQTSVITTQPQNIITTQPHSISQTLPFLETNLQTSDSCDESLTTQNNVRDTSSTLNRPPLPLIPTTRTLQFLTLAQFFHILVHIGYQLQQKHLGKLLYQHYQRILPYHQQVKLQ